MTPKPYSQVRQLSALEFLDIVFANIGEDDGIVFSVGDQRVWFPPRSPDIKKFLAENADVRVSLISLNDFVFGVTEDCDSPFVAVKPSIYLASVYTVHGQGDRLHERENCGVWVFEEPLKLDSYHACFLSEAYDLEHCIPLPGRDGWRRVWEKDCGTTYDVAAFIEANTADELDEEAEAQDALCNIEPEGAAHV
jgi:hypothetical protein